MNTYLDRCPEEEIAICESLIIAINESPGTSVVDDWEIIEISSDEEDEVVEIIADVGSWRNAEDTAQQWRKEPQSMITEGNKLEQRATRAFNNANGRKGREVRDRIMISLVLTDKQHNSFLINVLNSTCELQNITGRPLSICSTSITRRTATIRLV